MNYDDLCDLIHDALPGRGVWFQSASDPEEVHQEGLAIRQVLSGSGSQCPPAEADERRGGHHYVVCYFRVVPEEGRLDEAGEVVDPHEPEAWRVEVGYRNEVDTPGEAHREARDLVRYLPLPSFMKDGERQRLIFDTTIGDLLADAEADARAGRTPGRTSYGHGT